MNTTDRSIVANGTIEDVRTYIDEACGDSTGDEATDQRITDRMWDALWDAGHIDRNPGGENLGYVLYFVEDHDWWRIFFEATEGI
jgi:hypothetical protein